MTVESSGVLQEVLNTALTEDVAFCIRKAQLDDLRILVKLLGELFAIESDFKADFDTQYRGLKLLFDTPHCDILVAKYKNSAIGMVTVQRVISSAEGGYAGLIEDVVVNERYRGRGVGHSLIEAVITLAKEKGYVRLQLGADVGNLPALSFYQKRGFRQTSLNLYHLTDLHD